MRNAKISFFGTRSIALCFALLLLTYGTVCAAEGTEQTVAPPELPDDTFEHVPSTVDQRLSLQFALGKFVGSFEETTLRDVMEIAGSGDIQHRGDAGQSMYWLCYSLTSSHSPQRLWIISNAEMGGSKHAVTEIDVESVSTGTASVPSCPELPKNLQPTIIYRGITLV